MFHLCAYFASALTAATDADVPALTDSVLVIQNTHFLPQTPMQVWAAYATSLTHLRSKISTPKLRVVSPSYIRPIQTGVLLPAANPNMDLRIYSPLQLQQLEEIQILASNTSVGGEHYYALIWLVNAFQPAPLGDVFHLRWTGTTTAVASAWTNISPVTFENVLPWGTYTVIDSEAFSTSIIAHRLIFNDQVQRPGSIGFASNGSRQPYAYAMGKMGAWGSFHTTNLPQFEVLCNAADTSYEGYLHVVRTS
jgi:hypothetical protein